MTAVAHRGRRPSPYRDRSYLFPRAPIRIAAFLLPALFVLLVAGPADIADASGGRRPIVFSMCFDTGCGSSDLFTIRADGSGRTRLGGTRGLDAEPRWSPDRERVAFSCRGGAYLERADICVMNVLTKRTRVVTRTEAAEYAPAWSPNGRRLAFVRNVAETGRPANLEIFIINLRSGVEQRVTTSSAMEDCPEWSPDGDQLLFLATTRESSALHVIELRGSTARPLSSPTDAARCGSWSPDGSKIAFSRWEEDREGLGGSWKPTLLDIVTAQTRRIGTVETADGLNPQWSAGGGAVVFEDLVGGGASGIFE